MIKPIFRTDIVMVIAAPLSLLTGAMIHFSDHHLTHNEWHLWSVAHIVINIILVVFAILHIKQHLPIYRSFKKLPHAKKRGIAIVSLAFALVLFSGLYVLCFCEGQGNHAGIVHLWLGGVFSLAAIGHFAKRKKIFKKGVSQSK